MQDRSQPVSIQSQNSNKSSSIISNLQESRNSGAGTLQIPYPLSILCYAWKTGGRLIGHCFKKSPYSSPLGKKLLDASIPGRYARYAFIPVTVLSELLTEETIKRELSIHPCLHVSQNASRWAPMIVSPSETSETGAKKIFGLLCLLDRVDLIEGFIESEPRHRDDELPFKIQDLPSDEKHCKFEFLRGIQSFVVGDMLNMQWRFLAPVFRRIGPDSPVQHLPEGMILPMYKDKEQRQPLTGHSGSVEKVMVHKDHYVGDQEASHLTDAGTAPMDLNGMVPYAIKRLHLADGPRYEEHYAEACKKELDNLMRVRELGHENLIGISFGFFQKKRCYLVFPWANGNLRDFWRDKYPDPDSAGTPDRLSKWILSQCLGLLHGLELIHNNGSRSGLGVQGAATYGTHGDLKPENILWFIGQSKLDEIQDLGLLKISDFAGTQFHRKSSKSRVNWNELHTTDTYQAPETTTDYMVGQGYDLWSLGCVFLEFITWYIAGWEGVDNFSKARSVDNDPSDAPIDSNDTLIQRYEAWCQADWAQNSRHSLWPSDTFFYALPRGPHRHAAGARLKRSVHNHFNQLYQDARCSRFCADFLKVIEERFLRVNKRNRVSSNDILQRFDEIKREGESDAQYWTKPPERPVRARTNLSELIAGEPELDVIPEASSQRQELPEEEQYVSVAPDGNGDQSMDASLIAVARAGPDSGPPKDSSFLAPPTMSEAGKRASYCSSQTAASSQSGVERSLHSSHDVKLEMETQERRPKPTPRRRYRVKVFLRVIILEKLFNS
ncbi:hypothetical protein PG984_002794 [Apiospora sp. TS-2023a]